MLVQMLVIGESFIFLFNFYSPIVPNIFNRYASNATMVATILLD